MSKLKNLIVLPEFTGHIESLIPMKFYEKMLLILKGDRPLEDFDEQIDALLNHTLPIGTATHGTCGLTCLSTFYLFEKWDAALKMIENIKNDMKSLELAALFYLPEYFFFVSLVYLTVYQKASFGQKLHYRHQIKSNLRKLKKSAKTLAHLISKLNINLFLVDGYLLLTNRKKRDLLLIKQLLQHVKTVSL